MLRKFLLFLLAISSCGFASSNPEDEKRVCIDQLKEAFELQSKGVTRSAYYSFKEAYQRALSAGVPASQIQPLLDLFMWYRRCGYCAGMTFFPSGVTGEYYTPDVRPREAVDNPIVLTRDREAEYRMQARKNPEQDKHIRQFLYGVAMVVSGVFAIAVDPPLLGKPGWSLCIGGFTQMYLGLSNGWAEWELRTMEIQKIEKQLQYKKSE